MVQAAVLNDAYRRALQIRTHQSNGHAGLKSGSVYRLFEF